MIAADAIAPVLQPQRSTPKSLDDPITSRAHCQSSVIAYPLSLLRPRIEEVWMREDLEAGRTASLGRRVESSRQQQRDFTCDRLRRRLCAGGRRRAGCDSDGCRPVSAMVFVSRGYCAHALQ